MAKKDENYTPDRYRVVGLPTTAKGKWIGVIVKDSDKGNTPILTCGHRTTHTSKTQAAECMRAISRAQYAFNIIN